ncbi:MAG: hypothetical protein H7Y10_12160 [Flavobacterium sp.]|nr:hypothetical protein [Flavobacterium sp.]
MKTIEQHGFYIVCLLVGLLFTLAGFLYEMYKYRINRFKKTPGSCDHGFDFYDVIDMSIDPECKRCGKKLSETETEKSITTN